MPKINLFTKIVALIVLILAPILILYFYSNRTSANLLEQELNKSNTNQLVFFQNQVNTVIDTMALWPDLLIQDPDISSLRDIFTGQPELDLNTITQIKRIQTKLAIQENSANWKSSLHIYSPVLQRDISDSDVRLYDDEELRARLKPGWQVRQVDGSSGQRYVFSRFAVTPYSSTLEPGSSSLVIEIQFDSSNIADMLDKFKNGGSREPIYYHPDAGMIYNRSADIPKTDQVLKLIQEHPVQDLESRMVALEDGDYLVNIVKSETIGWYLIDYLPITEIMKPIDLTKRLFYYSVVALLLLCSIAAYLLYAQVQVPIRRLVVGFQKLKNGDYSFRIQPRGHSEFTFLYTRFNRMVEQIQELFETVYLEKIHVREARLKQLQSQINPHFFYNCFSFISSMAKLENYKPVVAMSHHLSKYYRYTTRQERELVSLKEEVDFVTSYLEIQNMRISRLSYSLNIPGDMHHLQIPPLVLQPLVENAVIHGIEASMEASTIVITGAWTESGASLTVEDNGRGMEAGAMLALQHKMQEQMDEQMGCGLWNVNQRMHLRYRGEAGVSFSASPLGGLRVSLSWLPA
jgi:two-component system sensor histidine kinase YesM